MENNRGCSITNLPEIIKLQSVMRREDRINKESASVEHEVQPESCLNGLGLEFMPVGRPEKRDRYRAVLCPTARCNSRCAFCFGSFTDREPTAADIMKAMLHIVASRFPHLLLTGGEPTLFPNIAALVNAFVQTGGWGVWLQTNGLCLDNKLACDLKIAGLDVAVVSLHGVTQKTHEAAMRCRDSFRKTIRGIENSLRAGIITAICFVIYEGNYRELPELPGWLRKRFGKDIFTIFNFVGPVHKEGITDPRVIPSYTAVSPHLEKAVERMLGEDQPFYISNFLGAPLCAFPFLIPYRKSGLFNTISEAPGFAKLDFCSSCSMLNHCPGFPGEYLRRHNDTAGFQPIKECLNRRNPRTVP